MRRTFFVVVLAVIVGGCSWFGSESGEKPAELVDFEAAATITEAWSEDIGNGPGNAFIRLDPAQQDGVIYVSDVRGNVRALVSASGKEIWSVSLDRDVSGGVGLGDDMVLVASNKGQVIALDRKTGKKKWETNASSEVLAPPVTGFGMVVVHSVDGRLTAFSGANGRKAWTVERAEPALTLRGTATPLVLGDAVLTGFATGKLLAVSLANGKVLWETTVGEPQGRTEIERLVDVDVPALVVGRALLTAAYQSRVVSISLENGAILWSRDISTPNAMAADASHVYITDSKGHVYALNRDSGSTVWKQDKLSGRQVTGPAVVGPAIAVADFEGYVHWLARDDGHFIARERAGSSQILGTPIADGATLFVQSQNARLSALRIDARKP